MSDSPALRKLTDEVRAHRQSVDREIERLRAENRLLRTISALTLRYLAGPSRPTDHEQGVQYFIGDSLIRAFEKACADPTWAGVSFDIERSLTLRGYKVVVTGPSLLHDRPGWNEALAQPIVQELTEGVAITTSHPL